MAWLLVLVGIAGSLALLPLVGLAYCWQVRRCVFSSSHATYRAALLKQAGLTNTAVVHGFFHPYCNAGGGGERVLWTCVQATLREYANAFCVVYSGDTDATAEEIIQRAHDCFGIRLDPRRVHIAFLHKRYYVSPEAWPRFTLIGQSLGSIPLGMEALVAFRPDIFIDTMGYAFTYPFVAHTLHIPIIAYVHYPTISTDMLRRVSVFNVAKQVYWRAFAVVYGLCGRYADIVLTNSTWTSRHIRMLWKENTVLYPPCDTRSLQAIPIDTPREQIIVMVSQFRPEKNHPLAIRAMKKVVQELPEARLVLIGSVRGEKDMKRVAELKELVSLLGLNANVQILTDVPWDKVVEWYGRASVGANTMREEHFGIGVVEYQAAGLIAVVHDTAGPKLDIVVSYEGKPTGFHAHTEQDFSDRFVAALRYEDVGMRHRARKNAQRFSESEFDRQWLHYVAESLCLMDNGTKKTA